MNENAYRRLGEVLVDELLLRAGLAQTGSEPVSFSVGFVVDADPDTQTVTLKCDRTNTSPLELRFQLPRD